MLFWILSHACLFYVTIQFNVSKSWIKKWQSKGSIHSLYLQNKIKAFTWPHTQASLQYISLVVLHQRHSTSCTHGIHAKNCLSYLTTILINRGHVAKLEFLCMEQKYLISQTQFRIFPPVLFFLMSSQISLKFTSVESHKFSLKEILSNKQGPFKKKKRKENENIILLLFSH